MAQSQPPKLAVEQQQDSVGSSYKISQLLGLPNPQLKDTSDRGAPSDGNFVTISLTNIKKLNGFTHTTLGLFFEDYLKDTVTMLPEEEAKLLDAQTNFGPVRSEQDFERFLKPWLTHNALYCINKTIPGLRDRLNLPERTYSLVTQYRYAFLVTAEYLTIFRFNRISKDEEDNEEHPELTVLGVEYCFLPYSNEGEQQLTLTEAIWALTLMAQHPQHRNLIPLGRMLPLNSWYTHAKDGHTYYIHHISELVRDTSPGDDAKFASCILAKLTPVWELPRVP
ncbi:hypothetical protein PG993_007873 [Apiospora rasikravindrae]|uniref:Uncharacterized protein n=1 Tax=Apiospora rasikravindrae TaxID=990691 RepID=A0ABR1SYQ9_9PEZI